MKTYCTHAAIFDFQAVEGNTCAVLSPGGVAFFFDKFEMLGHRFTHQNNFLSYHYIQTESFQAYI